MKQEQSKKIHEHSPSVFNKDGEHSPRTFNRKIHELRGIITHKEPYKVYHKNSPYNGNLCYKLQTIFKNQDEKLPLFIYPNLVNPQIYQTIEQSQFIDKYYLFFCEKKKKGWVLHNWQELSPNLNNSIENHEKK